MQSRRRTDKVCDLIPIRRLVEVIPEPFAAAQQYRRVRQVHFIDQTGAQISLDG
jgi:hypothetical protein